jgi:predicted cupin superfamily sugar epimerase
MNLTAIEYVKLLELNPHPEGGWYKEMYRSTGKHSGVDEFPQGRNYSTAIYFLIEKNNFSAFHKIKSDETWHFYAGDALEVIEIDSIGVINKTIVGPDIQNGHLLQYTVPAGNWFASRVYNEGAFSLVGCTVAPGFDFRDFDMADREQLVNQFPDHLDVIRELTRE